MSDEPKNPPVDHGELIERPRPRISLAWLFPILAALAAGWLLWSNWQARGPEIEIAFEAAPGMQANKTPLIYRGVTSGIVTALRLDAGMQKVIVTVRLKAFAADLAREGTVFWIDQPIVGLGETSGLDALIQGNSLQARIGSGPPRQHFTGVEQAPLTPLDAPALVLQLRAANIPLLDRGSPVFFRGMQVGSVEDKTLDERGNPFLRVVIENKFATTVQKNARFWAVPGTSIRVGQGGVKLEMLGLKSILLGGIEFEVFGPPEGEVADEMEFTLFSDRLSAQSTGAPVRIRFKDGQGIQAGVTEVRYLGVPVGFIETAQLNEAGQTVDTVARFQPAYEHLHPIGTRFTLVRPSISLNGITGLETLVSGVYVDCLPGSGSEIATEFAGHTLSDERLNEAMSESEGIQVLVEATHLPAVEPGAPVLHRGVMAGRVKSREVGADGTPHFRIAIRKNFAAAVCRNTRFWPIPGAAVEAGPGVMKMQFAGISALIQGGLVFETFGSAESPVATGAKFPLYASEVAARAISPPIRITFDNGQGLLAGQTQVRYLGLPVGIVESVSPKSGQVEAIVRLNDGYDFLRREGSAFTIVRLNVSLNGITGLETVVSGVYVECVPAERGKLSDTFTGVSLAKADFEQLEERGFEVSVVTTQTNISEEAPVFYRGLAVGKVARKTLSADGRTVTMTVVIQSPYASLLHENTKFWDASGAKISLGFFSLKVQAVSLDALARGAIAFATPNNSQMGAPVKRGHEFNLNAAPRREWLNWSPDLPVER